jgi:hypothetical protein
MGWGRISDGDNLFRHCIHPNSFRGRSFLPEKFIYIKAAPDRSLHASLVWERFVPTTGLLHDSGCRLALHMNQGAQAGGKYEEENKKIYCGAYQLQANTIRALTGIEGLEEVASADVVHSIEGEEFAHADLRIVLKSGKTPNIEGTKTAIVTYLWAAYRGPLKHVCDCDKDAKEHPSSALGVPPRGRYSDTRSSIFRAWSIVRYHICFWIWRKLSRSGG